MSLSTLKVPIILLCMVIAVALIGRAEDRPLSSSVRATPDSRVVYVAAGKWYSTKLAACTLIGILGACWIFRTK